MALEYHARQAWRGMLVMDLAFGGRRVDACPRPVRAQGVIAAGTTALGVVTVGLSLLAGARSGVGTIGVAGAGVVAAGVVAAAAAGADAARKMGMAVALCWRLTAAKR